MTSLDAQWSPPRGSRRDGRIATVIVLVIVLVAVGLTLAWWLLRPPYVDPVDAAPADSLAFVTLDLRTVVERGTKPNEIWELAKRKGFDETLRSGAEQVIKGYGSEFGLKTDLLDWCGPQIAIASFPVSGGGSDGALLVTVRDLRKAKRTLAKVRRSMAEKGSTVRTSRYRGVNIAVGQLGADPVACGMISRLVVLTATDAGVRTIVDVVRDGRSLQRTDSYRTAMASVDKEAFVRGYWTTPEFSPGADPESAPLVERLLAALLAFRDKSFRASAAALSLREHGVLIEAVSTEGSGAKLPELPACVGDVAEHLPESTVALAVFGSPDGYWSLIRDLPDAVLSPLLGENAQQALDELSSTIGEQTGIPLEKGWLSWMNRESAIALTQPQLKPAPPLVVILGTDKPEQMKASFASLRLRALLLPGLMVPAPDIEHSPWLDSLTAVRMPLPIVGASPIIATAEDAAVIAASPQAISTLLPRAEQSPLTQSAKYRWARNAIPERPAAFVYVDVEAAMETAGQAATDIVPLPMELVAPQVKGIESLAAAVGPDPAGQRIVLWLGTDWNTLFARQAPAKE